jgi:rubrerythrin
MRRIGEILIGLSVAIAVGGGLLLSIRMNEYGLAGISSLAALLFIVVTVFAALGIYFYVRGERSTTESEWPRTETELARRLSDALGEGDRVTFQALADALDTDPEAVARLLSELARIEVLPAAVNWEAKVIYPKNRGYLLRQWTCLNCGTPLQPDPKAAVCTACRTIHYDV